MKKFGLLDGVGVLVLLVAVALVAAFPVAMYSTMFADFSSPANLPSVTRFLLWPWARAVLLAPTVVSLLVTVARRGGGWRPWLWTAALLGLLAFGSCELAVHLPLWQMADKVQ